jgi:hypothetical protein
MSRGCGGKCERRRATASTSPAAASPAQNFQIKEKIFNFLLLTAPQPCLVIQFIDPFSYSLRMMQTEKFMNHSSESRAF